MKFQIAIIFCGFLLHYTKGMELMNFLNWIIKKEQDKTYPPVLFLKESNNITLQWKSITSIQELISDFMYACPAEDKKQIEINQKESLTKNTLFMKNIKSVETLPSCKTEVIPSIIPLNEPYYVIGYEVYLGENDLYKKFPKRKGSLNERTHYIMYILTSISSSDQNDENTTIQDSLTSPLDEMIKQEEKDSTNQRSDQNINLNIDSYDLNLGNNEFFNNKDVDYLYTIENQDKIFSNIFDNPEEKLQYFDPEHDRYLVKHFLVEPNDLTFENYTKAISTYANVIPIWKTIKLWAWNNLSDLLRRPQFLSDNHIMVVTGTYGTLTFSKKITSSENEKSSENLKEIYLADDKTFPVPYAFWKFIQYIDAYVDEHDKDNVTNYEIIIIIHNNPYDKNPQILCEENICEKYGWKPIQNRNPLIGFTYCCEASNDLIEKLQITELIGREVHPETHKVLTLNKVEELQSNEQHTDKENEKKE